jgi:hypothetical protein
VSGHCHSVTAVRRHLALHSANALQYLSVIISGSLIIEIMHGGIVNLFVLMQDQGNGEGVSPLLSLRRPGVES